MFIKKHKVLVFLIAKSSESSDRYSRQSQLFFINISPVAVVFSVDKINFFLHQSPFTCTHNYMSFTILQYSMIMTALKINYSNCAIGDLSTGKFLCKMQMKRLKILSYFTHEKITKKNSIDFVY